MLRSYTKITQEDLKLAIQDFRTRQLEGMLRHFNVPTKAFVAENRQYPDVPFLTDLTLQGCTLDPGVQSMFQRHTCTMCGITRYALLAGRLQKCRKADCRTYYCSTRCQKRDWHPGFHQGMCPVPDVLARPKIEMPPLPARLVTFILALACVSAVGTNAVSP